MKQLLLVLFSIFPLNNLYGAQADQQELKQETALCSATLPKEPSHPVSSVSYSPNGSLLAAGFFRDPIVKIYNSKTLENVQTLQDTSLFSKLALFLLSKNIYSISWSPNEAHLATGCDDGDMMIWDIESGACLKKLKKHSDSIYSVSYSPNGTQLASGSRDQTIVIWDPRTCQPVHVLGDADHLSDQWWNVNAVSWSPDGEQLAAGYGDGRMRIWSHNRIIFSSPAFHAYQDTSLATECVEKYYYLPQAPKKPDYINTLMWSADGEKLAAGHRSGRIRIWNPNSHNCMHTLQKSKSTICSLSYSPNSTHLISGSKNGIITVWDPNLPEPIYTLQAHTDAIRSISSSPNNIHFASGSNDKTIKIWEKIKRSPQEDDDEDRKESLQSQSDKQDEDTQPPLPLDLTSGNGDQIASIELQPL